MTNSLNNIAVIGAGAWGTALAQVLAEAGRQVTLYARDPGLAEAIGNSRLNHVYLPGISLNGNLRATAQPGTAVREAGLVLLATPTQFVRETVFALKDHLSKEVPLINCAKGIEIVSGRLLSEVVAETAPDHPYGVLSGPTFAAEVARGLPTAVTLAAHVDEATAQAWAQALSGPTFRPYLSHDPIGAEVAGAVKNVIAIACGIVEGRGLGQNAKAAIMTRGMAEIKRLGMKKGAAADSFLGLAGIGDLTLTCHSMSSRNYSLGFELGCGLSLQQVLAGRCTVTEGVTTAKAVAGVAAALNIDMPICLAVNKILHHSVPVEDVIKSLLARDLKYESV